MNEIANPDHPVLRAWLASETGWISQIQAAIQAANAHPARCVVLLPYAQLMPTAARMWARAVPLSFAPRFETTANWSESLGGALDAMDVQFDMAQDLLTARQLLKGASWAQRADELLVPLVEMVYELAPLASAVPPSERTCWMARALQSVRMGFELPALDIESALAQTAVSWAATSGYRSDVLFGNQALAGVDLVVMMQGLHQEPLWQTLQARWAEQVCVLPMTLSADAVQPFKRLAYQAKDVHEEATFAAALTVTHINQGRAPVALVATDRALIRRVRAMLGQQGVSIRDEQGWRLSTSQAGAMVMAALRAMPWQASSDQVLSWLKTCLALSQEVLQEIETTLRRHPERFWPSAAWREKHLSAPALALLEQVDAWRASLQGTRILSAWMDGLASMLNASGVQDKLVNDAAGESLLDALHLRAAKPVSWGKVRLSLGQFTQWVSQTLEATSFKPAYPLHEQVVILPMSQLLGRAFGATVLAGCDEVRLPAWSPPAGPWTVRQREALGLPSREDVQAQTLAAWNLAMQCPHVSVLWRTQDDNGEPLLPSPLVQSLLLKGTLVMQDVPMHHRSMISLPVLPPAPVATDCLPSRLSASAYEDLRKCPYRFFALRVLGLQEDEELDQELDKRDLGIWLHEVLKRFHESDVVPDLSGRRLQLDKIAQGVVTSQGIDEESFLPFKAAWPALRDGYLRWLAEHEARGASFVMAEQSLTQPLTRLMPELGCELVLSGTLDRVDVVSPKQGQDLGERLVMDYKTEPIATTKERLRSPFEDTQLAFYALLMPEATRAAYLNVGERDGTTMHEQTALLTVREALREGVRQDFARLQAGTPLSALGEAQACEFCAARGLCRKDAWAGIAEAEEGQA